MARVQHQAHVLQLPAVSSLDSVRAALARLESCEALLVFPPCAAGTLARPEALAALRAFCREQEIVAVFVGGDETLRALAVAEGFAAATSLDAWESQTPGEVAAVTLPSEEEWAAADAALVATARRSAGDDGMDSWHADPPEYVMRLLGGEGGYTGPRDEPTPQEAERLRAEEGATDPLLRAHRDYEERMTTTIRVTGRMQTWRPWESVPAGH